MGIKAHLLVANRKKRKGKGGKIMGNRMGEVKQKLRNRNSPTYCVTVEHLAKIPLETKAGPIFMKRPEHT